MILRRITAHMKTQNWFAVVLDLVIVVVGVGIAMYGQQWLSDRQQRADMAVAETALQIDLKENYHFAKGRIALVKCRAESYQAIAAQLLSPGETWKGIARAAEADRDYSFVLPVVFRSPNRTWGSRIWAAELGRGTFNQMNGKRRENLDYLFRITDDVNAYQADIFALQGRLKILAVSTTISQSDRLRYYEMLGEMDDKSNMIEILAQDIIQTIEKIGIQLPAEERQAHLEYSLNDNEEAKERYGECYQLQKYPALEAYLKKAKTP